MSLLFVTTFYRNVSKMDTAKDMAKHILIK